MDIIENRHEVHLSKTGYLHCKISAWTNMLMFMVIHGKSHKFQFTWPSPEKYTTSLNIEKMQFVKICQQLSPLISDNRLKINTVSADDRCWETVQVLNTMDSLYIMVTYDTIVHTAQQLQWKKNSVRFALINDTPYLALMGCLFASYDRDISRAHCKCRISTWRVKFVN